MSAFHTITKKPTIMLELEVFRMIYIYRYAANYLYIFLQESVMRMSSLFHAFILCQVNLLY